MLDYRVISIGALSAHPLWQEPSGLRTAHATTTLVRTDAKTILVDPALPAPVLTARLHERAGLTPDAVSDVFLTNFRPVHRGALEAFPHAHWWISEAEREIVGVDLVGQFDRETDEPTRDLLRREIVLLQRCKNAPDSLAPHVDLFPLPGYTPGTCGLLLALAQATVLIASDAIATSEHLQHGQVLAHSYDLKQATESFAEAVEIADWIIPGHDNLTPNLARRIM